MSIMARSNRQINLMLKSFRQIKRNNIKKLNEEVILTNHYYLLKALLSFVQIDQS